MKKGVKVRLPYGTSTFRYPTRCPCCGEFADSKMDFQYQWASLTAVGTSVISVPYCAACLLHVEGVPREARPRLAGFGGVSTLIGACTFAGLFTFVVAAFGLPVWLVGVLWPLEVVIIAWLMIPRIRRDTEKLRNQEASLLKPTCIDSGPVVTVEVKLGKPVFHFADPAYAEDFQELNR